MGHKITLKPLSSQELDKDQVQMKKKREKEKKVVEPIKRYFDLEESKFHFIQGGALHKTIYVFSLNI